MLELYEQNRAPPSSDIEGSAASGATHRPPTKATTSSEEHVTTNNHSQAGGMRPGASKPATSRSASELSYADNHGGPTRTTESRSNEYGSTEMRSFDHKLDNEFKYNHGPEPQQLPNQDRVEETKSLSRFTPEGPSEGDQASNAAGKSEGRDGEFKDRNLGWNLEIRQGNIGRSPQEVIKKIDKDKVKAALEKRRKSIGDVTRKTDFMDEDDLIEKELEDGIELATGSEKTKRDRKQNWSKLSSRLEHDDSRQGKHQEEPREQPPGPDLNNVEEGEVSVFDNAGSEVTQIKPLQE